MYYVEKIIDGQLMYKTSPDGDWRPVTSAVADLVNLLVAMSPESRQEVLQWFCKACGDANRNCQCWNDE